MTRRSMNMLTAGAVMMAACLLASPRQSAALIKADFTPVHLVKQSSLILELRIETVKDGRAAVTVKRAIKGKADAQKLVLDLKTAAVPEQAEDLGKKLAAARQAPLLLFTSEVPGGDGPRQMKAYLHVEGTWAVLFSAKAGLYQLDGLDTAMLGTWNGGTDMLARAVDSILADDSAAIPVAEGVSWSAGGARKFATLAGKVHSVCPVRLSEGGKPVLHIAAAGGDRLFEYAAAGNDLKDVTAAHQLTAKSIAAAWGDFNADGRLDLLSWDGESLALHTQDAKGCFQGATTPVTAKVVGLATTNGGAIISTAALPLFWTPGGGKPAALQWDAAAAGELGQAGPCLVADLDGDGIADILQPFAKGSLLYKGKGQGNFAPASPCPLALGAVSGRAFLGDLDGDGLLDVLVASPQRCGVWQNLGGFQFAETLALCGELAYKANADVIFAQACDFNRDGRQDLLLLSSSGFPALFFSRGFRCFGYANDLDLEKCGLVPDAKDGQQAGCIADLKGDGSQELVLVLAGGECWALPFETGSMPASIRAVLPLKAGPRAITAWWNGRCLGAWTVTGGTDGTTIASGHPGPIVLRWLSPDGKPHEKATAPASKPVRVAIEP